MRTQAAVLWGRGQDWRIEEIELDPPRSQEVLVKWAAAGLCHSDEHLRDSDMGSSPPGEPPRAGLFPMVGGHEGGGVVVEVGPNVDSVAPGDHVAASFFPICGRCRMCITGHSNLCDLGAATFAPGQISDGTARYHLEGTDSLNVMAKLGTFAQHSVCHEASLVKVDPEVPLEAVALVSCGVTTGWGSAVYRAEVRPGNTVVVVGVGGVGINAVQGARMVGAKHVVAVDPVEFKRKSALDFGATHTVASMEEAMPIVTDLTRGQMADAVIMVPGVMYGDLMAGALALTGKGGTCVVTGVAPQLQTECSVNLFDLAMMQKEIKGVIFGAADPRFDIPNLLALYKTGQLKLDELITRTYALDQINQGYRDMLDGVNLRGVVTFELSAAVDIDPLDLVDPARFARHGYPYATWATLRAEAPVAYMEPPGHPPFWAVTKHADIVEVATQPRLFCSSGGITLDMDLSALEVVPDMIVYLDPPQHGPLRKVANREFLKSAVRSKVDDIERIASDIVDAAATGGDIGACDFADTFAAQFPVAVISWILGVPKADWEHHFRWTNEVIGKDDPEYRQPGESPDQTSMRARGEIHRYFKAMVKDRRDSPRGDLVSHLVQSEIDGRPLTQAQLISYCELLVEAGNQTTRDAIAGGMQAFCEHRDQWERLRAEPGLLPGAVEEILRWVTPIAYFSRTATEDCELRGQKIRAGDKVALYWASANRDEDVFENPLEFRIDRPLPAQHLVFGFGPHLCMGAHVARAELAAMFGLLASRMEWFEQAGPLERLNSSVNGAIKHLPIRYRLT